MSNGFWFLLGMAGSATTETPELSNLPLKERLAVHLMADGVLFVVALIVAVIVGAIDYWMHRW